MAGNSTLLSLLLLAIFLAKRFFDGHGDETILNRGTRAASRRSRTRHTAAVPQPQRPPMVVCRESGAPSAEAAAADSSTLPRRKRGRPLAFFAAESPHPRRKIHPNSGTCFHLRAKI